MKTSINKYEFRDAFTRMGRSNNFSYDGLGVLFDYFESFEEDTGEEIELDVIAICCEFNEETAEEIRENYSIDADQDLLEYLEHHTQVAGITDNGSIVYAAF
jgi:hypothetical protein